MQFTIESFHNPYLAPGTTRVDTVLTITAGKGGGEEARRTGASVIGLILDTSGSMQGERIEAVKHAARRAIALLPEDAQFFICRFASNAQLVYPLSPATANHKALADEQLKRLYPTGDTQMSTGMLMARSEFLRVPGAIHQALFLTDGKNNESDEAKLDVALAQCEGVFQCECRGVGTDWQVKQLQKIAGRLLGTAQLIANPSGLEADFAATIQKASERGIGGVRLRLWSPKNVKIVSVKQMSPEIALLTDRGVPVDAQAQDYPLGAWGAESRDYYIAAELSAPGDMGEELLVLRPSVIYESGGTLEEVKNPSARVVAAWTGDEALSARINSQVAHYTGQGELAEAIQDGLEARSRGDIETATRLLGKAAKLAQASGNDETTSRLKKVVEIVDAAEGTVRLKAQVQKADEMDLDLGSTRTSRARRSNS